MGCKRSLVGAAPSRDCLSNLEIGAPSFDDEIAQVPSQDGADRYSASNSITVSTVYLKMHHISTVNNTVNDNHAMDIGIYTG